MTAAEKRKASGDYVKRVTYRYQWWLATWRALGGSSDDEHARYMRRQCQVARAAARRASGPFDFA